MGNAIISKWECPSCGNILTKKQTLDIKGNKHSFGGPEKCGCGRKGSFRLLKFEDADCVIIDSKHEAIIVPKDRAEELNEIVTDKIKESNEEIAGLEVNNEKEADE